MSKVGGHLTIESHGLHGHGARIWLDGQEISHCLTEVTVRIGRDAVTHAELSILVDRIEVDAQTLAALQAVVDADNRAKLALPDEIENRGPR